MFGVGAQEMVVVGLLCLVVFGPRTSAEMARECGRLARKARASFDELKSELTPELNDNREPTEERGDREPAVGGEDPEADPKRGVSETEAADGGPR